MANGHGGARPGAGRKKRPLADKIAEDFPGKRKPKVLNIDGTFPFVLNPPGYLEDFAALDIEPDITGIYNSVVEWLKRTGCLHLINPEFITEYALLKTCWIECEFMVSNHIVLQNYNGEIIANPAVDMALKYLKQADVVWAKIWSIVAQNCETSFGNDPHNDLMEKLIGMHREG